MLSLLKYDFILKSSESVVCEDNLKNDKQMINIKKIRLNLFGFVFRKKAIVTP